MSRFFTRSTQLAIDFAVLSLALWAAFYARFDGPPPFLYFKRLLFVWPYVVGLQYAILAAYGVPRFSWRYIGLRDVSRILMALATAAFVLLVVRLVAAQIQPRIGHAQYVLIPIGITLIDTALAFLGIVGVRALRRLLGERATTKERSQAGAKATPTILIGAGEAGVLVAKELAQNPDLGMTPIGFLDDNPLKQKIVVHGVPVLGTTNDLGKICSKHGIEQALITIASARGKDIRRISELCRAQELHTKIIPGLYEIVGGKVNLSRIRELDIEDLLGRDPVHLDETAISREVHGRVILVSGAGGSIGSELCRQVCRFGPAALVLVEQAENPLFEIHRELSARCPEVPLVPCIGDVGDRERMLAVFGQHHPQVVFHAAAHKHVPMMEANPGEAIKNNVLGTKVLADVAHEHSVDAFVMISTDKAVNPSSIMGASKRLAEMYAQALAKQSQTRFVTVRFGNVLGSAGSVIPIFKDQIAKGGPVTVTHPEMKRYFMTIPEACQLVLQAGTMGHGGEIFILDMGEPVKIVDLARDLIELSGFEPYEEIEIEFSGIRPGEKLFEELSVTDEHADKTRHPKIFVGRGTPQEFDSVNASILNLCADADTASAPVLRSRMRELVPEFRAPSSTSAAPKDEASSSAERAENESDDTRAPRSPMPASSMESGGAAC